MSDKASKADKAATTPKWSLLESATWSPAQAGDRIEGTLGPSEDGPNGPQHTLTTENGAKTLLPHLVCLKDLDRVPLGAKVRITYKGDATSASSGKTYKAMSIEVATPSGGGAI